MKNKINTGISLGEYLTLLIIPLSGNFRYGPNINRVIL